MGQTEVACSTSKDASKIRWLAGQGIYFPKSTTSPEDDEL